MHLSGIDLDSCIADDGTIAPWAVEILSIVPTYTERSPSGRGLKQFFFTANKNVRPFLDQIGVPPDAWELGAVCRVKTVAITARP